MNINFQFGESGTRTPKVTIRDGWAYCRVTHPRWIQLLALLSFRRLTGRDSGRVAIGELLSSIAFRGIAPENTARYFKRNLQQQAGLFQDFVRLYIDIRADRPFGIDLDKADIVARIDQLDRYIHSTFHWLGSSSGDDDPQWASALAALNDFELRSAGSAFEQYFHNGELSDFHPAFRQALAIVNKTIIAYLLEGNTPYTLELLDRAQLLTNSMRADRHRMLIRALIYAIRVWTVPLTDYTLSATFNNNQNAIELALQLPMQSSDRWALLASRHYFRAYCEQRFGDAVGTKREMIKVRDYHRRIAEMDHPKVVPYERGVNRAMELQMELLRRSSARNGDVTECIGAYRWCVSSPEVWRVNTLSSAEWIAVLLNSAGRQVDALEFLTDAIIEHSMLHQTTVFRRVCSLRTTWLNQLSSK